MAARYAGVAANTSAAQVGERAAIMRPMVPSPADRPRPLLSYAWLAVAVLLAGATATGLYLGWFRESVVHRFNFAPQAAPDFPGFLKVAADTEYSERQGFGWLDARGEHRAAGYPFRHNSWESRDNLNLAMRTGPDDLARSFATGSATFAFDLEPGVYTVWLLTGDWGLLESLPFSALSY